MQDVQIYISRNSFLFFKPTYLSPVLISAVCHIHFHDSCGCNVTKWVNVQGLGTL